MAMARRNLIDPEITPFYHCMSRCVRRAWLCGEDPYTGFNFDHRKEWIEARMLLLGKVFAIDIAAYAVMSNHYHIVLRLDERRCNGWSATEVIVRWGSICRLPRLARDFLNRQQLSAAENEILRDKVETWRTRLGSISWFMRYINEPLARLANAEDDCTGRFWEGRFKSEALLDEGALVACMAYVDLNPVRAGIAETAESGEFTSIRRRVTAGSDGLAPLAEEESADELQGRLPINRKSYLDLLAWTGRTVVKGESGKLPQPLKPVVEKFGDSAAWLSSIVRRPSHGLFFGRIDRLTYICEVLGKSWVWGCGKLRARAPVGATTAM